MRSSALFIQKVGQTLVNWRIRMLHSKYSCTRLILVAYLTAGLFHDITHTSARASFKYSRKIILFFAYTMQALHIIFSQNIIS